MKRGKPSYLQKYKTPGVLLVLIIIASMLIAYLKSPTTESITTAKIYVANEGSGTISIIDAETLAVTKTLDIHGMPHNSNVDPTGAWFYATNHAEEDTEATPSGEMEHGKKKHIPYLRIFDAAQEKLIRSIGMSYMAAHVVPTREGKKVYVSREGGDTIVLVDVQTGEILRTYKVGFGPHGMVLSTTGKILYVPNMKSNDVSILNLETGEEERMKLRFEEHACETPVAMGITADDRYAVVTCGKSFDVYKIDTNAKKVVNRLAFTKAAKTPGPIQTPIPPQEQAIYIPDMGNGVVHKIDLASFTLIKDVPTGAGAHGIAYSADGRYAYITNTWENTVAVLDTATDTIIKKIPVGEEPNGIAVSNGKNQGW